MVEKVEKEHQQQQQQSEKTSNNNASTITPSKMRLTIKDALGRSTYERYRHRTLGDSDDDLTGTIFLSYIVVAVW